VFDFVQFIVSPKVVTFFLLFTRIGSIFVFMPFFSSATISVTVRAAIAFYMSIVFYPMVKEVDFLLSPSTLFIAVVLEMLFGFAIGIILRFAFWALQFAGEYISFVMGFSMATSIDPQSAESSQILSQFFNLGAILLFLIFDGHHLILLYLNGTLNNITLGGFLLTNDYIDFVIKESANLFIVGFSIAFPIIALSLLADIIFGMIMKTMPSFNLLVIGFPAKIAISFVVLVATFGAMMAVFRGEFLRIFNLLVENLFQA
jgi:flagellar biosynthetic protein FliR